MKKSFFVFCAALVFLSASSAPAAPRPMRVRQPAYGFEFDVYRTDDMPANWFKTYDGYHVTRRLDTNWVYGRRTEAGWVMTDVLVGSVDPRLTGAGPAEQPDSPSLAESGPGDVPRVSMLDERGEGPTDPPGLEAASRPTRSLLAELLYDIMEAEDLESLSSKLNQFFAMLGQLGVKKASEVRWSIGEDSIQLTLVLSGKSLLIHEKD